MNNVINKFFARLASDERGLTAVEYAVLGGLVVAAITAAMTGFNTELSSKFGALIP
jgi:pilus assembly protein Flp/PilA